MILYLDTSALVKRYFAELYTDEILLLWRQAAGIITSAVAYAETMAAFHRKKREASLDEAVIRSVVNGFHMDWAGFIRVEVTGRPRCHHSRRASQAPARLPEARRLQIDPPTEMSGSGKEEKVFYITFREQGQEEARKRVKLMSRLAITRVESSEELGLIAGRLKATRKLSFADAWIAATAVLYDSTLVHKDPEFEKLEDEVKVLKLPYKLRRY